MAATASAARPVPATLHASLMARLDRLGAAKEIAQIGAVIGRDFSHGLIATVAEKSEPELAAVLDRLVQAGMLSRQGIPPHASFLFKHALVQDAAYGTLLRSRRQQLHGKIVTALEEEFPEIAEAQPEILARHCAEAQLDEKAVRLLARRRGACGSSGATTVRALGISAEPWRSSNSSRLVQAARRPSLRSCLKLGPALGSVHGYSAPEVGSAFERAEFSRDNSTLPSTWRPPLVGLWLFHSVSGAIFPRGGNHQRAFQRCARSERSRHPSASASLCLANWVVSRRFH